MGHRWDFLLRSRRVPNGEDAGSCMCISLWEVSCMEPTGQAPPVACELHPRSS